METRQTQSDLPVGHRPSSFDIPTMIVVYTLVLVLAVGLCFCLRKANTLIPNRYNFPLSVRRNRPPNLDQLHDEEARHGLLNSYDDDDELLDDDDDVEDHAHAAATRWDALDEDDEQDARPLQDVDTHHASRVRAHDD
ncbi:hypothetical protein BC940DRAFT_303942 [Gongronella butleri]|nr:hypothetical protein BC940DRAFT_303942 [Gongronella butleri]